MMKNILFIFVSGFLLLNFSSSGIKAQSLVQNGEIPKDLVITLERSHNCDVLVFCPDYKLEIKSNGDISLDIKESNGEKARKINTNIDKEQIKLILDSFEKADFFQLQNEYKDGDICKIRATDQSSQIISIRINGEKKQVEHYLGCYIDEKEIVASLLSLGNKIDEIVETKRWIGKRK